MYFMEKINYVFYGKDKVCILWKDSLLIFVLNGTEKFTFVTEKVFL